MTLESERLRHRARAHGEDLQAPLPRLRSADHLRRPRLRGREEDHLARRLRRALGAAEVPVQRVSPLPRLLGYSRRYTGRFAVAFAAMLALRRRIGRRGLPDQADHRRRAAADRRRRQRCPTRGTLAFWSGAVLVAYLAKGIGAYFSAYLMTDIGQRVVRDLRDQLFKHILDQSAAFFSRWSTGPLMSRHHQRRQPGAAGRVGDGRRSAARRARALRLRRRCCSSGTGKLALVCVTGAPIVVYPLVRLGQRVRRSTRRSQEAHRASLAHRGRSLHRPPHRQGVRRRGAREPALQARLRAALSHQPEDHQHGRGAAAVDGVPRRPRGGGADLVRQPARSPAGGRRRAASSASSSRRS